MQFGDSAGNIAAGALIQTNTLSSNINTEFFLYLKFMLKGKVLFHETGN
jgi:hypothetical protein